MRRGKCQQPSPVSCSLAKSSWNVLTSCPTDLNWHQYSRIINDLMLHSPPLLSICPSAGWSHVYAWSWQMFIWNIMLLKSFFVFVQTSWASGSRKTTAWLTLHLSPTILICSSRKNTACLGRTMGQCPTTVNIVLHLLVLKSQQQR